MGTRSGVGRAYLVICAVVVYRPGRRGGGAARTRCGQAAGWLVTVLASAVLLGCSSGSDDLIVVQSESTYWPWETSPPTSTPPALAPAAESKATATVSPGPTPTETPTGSPEPTATGGDGSSSTPTATQSDPPDDGPSTSGGGNGSSTTRLANEVVTLTNAERQKAGCPPVTNDRTLRSVATAHSEDMAERNYFSHTSPDGEGPEDRAAAAGYDGYSGENIALGYNSAEAVVKGWMQSSGHRENILNCSSTEVGVGVADSSQGLYWTQMFGRG